ncbi:CBN-AAT-7 protein [Aphelenchoides fujianensis]|nr:CBN-AAT-7 protein [Aphelenchoides fujianensis]
MSEKLGLISCLAYVVGGMIGSGLFIVPSNILLHAGSAGLTLCLYVGGALFSILAALVYVELGFRVQESGGGFAYLMHVGWKPLAVPFFWLGTFFTYPMFLAIQATALGQLLMKTLEKWVVLDDRGKRWSEWAMGNGILALITVLNLFSVRKAAARFQVAATAFKLIVVVVIVALGCWHLLHSGLPAALKEPFANSTRVPFEVVLGLYSSLFCYSGWEVLSVTLGEVQNPKLTLPVACIGGILIVCVVCLSMNVAYFAVIDLADFANTSAVAVLFAAKTMGSVQLIVPSLIALLICGNLNMTMFGASRYMQAGAAKGALPSCIAYVHPRHGAPRVAVLLQFALAIGLSFVGNLGELIAYMSYAELLDRLSVQFAFLFMRYKGFPHPPSIYTNPLIIPVIFLVVCIALLLIPLYQDYRVAVLGLGAFGCSFLVYLLGIHFGLLERVHQLLLGCGASSRGQHRKQSIASVPSLEERSSL